jgi:hypothetical protein
MARATAAVATYFMSRLSGNVPLPVVFWRDMIVVGSGLMLLSLGLVLIMALNGAPTWPIIVAYVINWPYSGFVVVAVWRAAGKSRPALRVLSRAIALLWLAFSVVV